MINQYTGVASRSEATRARLTAAEAAAFLGVSRATLYAYVSRGKLRSLAGAGRQHLYPLEDLERVHSESQARRGHAPAASGALFFGAPVLTTRLSEIRPDGPAYRGVPVLELVRRGDSFEAVAEHLWQGGELSPVRPEWLPEALAWIDAAGSRANLFDRASAKLRAMPLGVALALLPELAALDAGRFLQSPASECQRGRRLLVALVLALASRRGARAVSRARRAGTLPGMLAVALGARPSAATCQALELALVLSADHELNPSTFAARIAAGTGADLYTCVSAAVATLSGPLHGGASARVEALVSEVLGSPSRAHGVILERTRRGEAIPGFGHALYTNGDPRAVPLFERARSLDPRGPRLQALAALERSMRSQAHEAPNLDFGLVALAEALALPPGAALSVFAVGRCAGWVAHVIEQRESGSVLRPRAQYRAE
ncbi:MAG TPA: citrate synthase family protein [Polyangiaceae bacterium]|nr:citrate synthase family protein [Polyangiaceae bacterium]